MFVGISGGVDSAVSAALLKEKGCAVTGVFIKIILPGYPCPAAQDRIEAMRAAAHLKIPFIETDLSKEYESRVFRPSIEEFKKGYTPNPDTLCNEKIKFGVFYDFARRNGAERIATGHYAQVRNSMLYVGKDKEKDQSYFLWGVCTETLEHTLFPVGHLTKKEVRVLAKKYGLPNAERKDSQGLCFLGDISLKEMLAREMSLTPGDVLSESGEVIGRHAGAPRYTLGERRGFTLVAHAPLSLPHYVVGKDMAHNTITVSPNRFPREARKTAVVLTHTNWIGAATEGECEARYRYRGALIPATIQKPDRGKSDNKGRASTEVVLKEPHYVPLGQSLVLYRDERCLGGGIIESATLIS